MSSTERPDHQIASGTTDGSRWDATIRAVIDVVPRGWDLLTILGFIVVGIGFLVIATEIPRQPPDAAIIFSVGGLFFIAFGLMIAVGATRSRIRSRQARRLIDDQGSLLAGLHAEWIENLLTTGPADRAAAEQAAAELYRRHGRHVPRFVWADSPVSAALIIGLLSSRVRRSVLAVSRRPAFADPRWFADPHWDVIGHQVRDSVSASLTAAFGDTLMLGDPLPPGWRLGRHLSFRDGKVFGQAADYFHAIRQEPWANRAIADHPLFLTLAHWDYPAEWIKSKFVCHSPQGGMTGETHYYPSKNLPGWLQDTLRFVRDEVGLVRDEVGPFPVRVGVGTLDLFRRIGLVGYDQHASAVLDLLVTITRSCGWCWLHERVCVLTERPTRLAVESVADGAGHQQLRLHCADGPALAYRDGRSHYTWHGVDVPEKIITSELTAADWLEETNTEVSRVIAERVGYARLLDQCQASRIGTDEYGTLWRLRHPHDTAANEAVVLLDVVNSTPEPGGSFRRYVLRVPPDQTVPRDAIGWTFGLPPGQYQPITMT